MADFKLGLVHTPLTPFNDDISIDFDYYRRILGYHIADGAEALALPMHVGESVSLSDGERKELLEVALDEVDGRIPVIAHITQSGTELAKELAIHAEKAGAAAIICTTPYYWKPQPAMMLSHFETIGGSVSIPFLLYNAPGEMGGTRITTQLTMVLLDRLENFSGLVDISLDWQYLIDVVSNAHRVKPNFQFATGIEYMISASAIGAVGMFAPHAVIAPKLVRQLYYLCREENYKAAIELQEEFACVYQAVKPTGIAGMKAASRLMGRDCGIPRPPLLPMPEEKHRALTDALKSIPSVSKEAQGW